MNILRNYANECVLTSWAGKGPNFDFGQGYDDNLFTPVEESNFDAFHNCTILNL